MKKIIPFILFLGLLSCEDYYDMNSYLGSSFDVIPTEQSEKYTDYGENPFIDVNDQSVSTFGIDADGGSFSNARRFINMGLMPPVASVRIEEYINYFTFNYPNPTSENVSIETETGICPWNQEHYLMRIGLKGKHLNANEMKSSNFVFLIDVSGSMSSPDKLELLKKGFEMLVDEMDETDRIAIVTYAGAEKVVLESTSCDNKSKIKRAIKKLGSGGSTAGAKGIITAYEIAEKSFVPNGNNRVIVGSDGDFNVGPSSNEELVELIEEKRESGIFLTVIGVGSGNLNDSMMEQLANNGNGNYEYIDNLDQMKKVFIHERERFFNVAKDAKIQVEFNASAIDSFRLIGYENRVLSEDDFEKDTVDAGEIGSGQTITAFYEIIPKNNGNGAIANLNFRYKKPNENSSRLITHEVSNAVKSFAKCSENTRFGAAITAYGLLLKQSKYKGNVNLLDVKNWAQNARIFDPHDYKSNFLEMIETTRSAQE